ncbi:OLC1v1006715C1 [Oldenlandia corymbosa var. corymbosa]|uniref:OLC1v1006715C1 n=1 Tax=Oldenlandia corymbosa var. corymbosa TaxID=529605 RepID=A0AAV1DHM3_OLDCO|nr:OLC1v1006715C1 [Oldenlandia corymbosa var. corymbosa]
MTSTTKVLTGGYLSLFPNTPSKGFGSQLNSPTRLRVPAKAYRARAVAAVCTPAQTSPESFYELLGISETGCSTSEIKRAYKQLARKYHPDVSPSGCTEEYTQRFIMVKEAYETLSDPQTRAMYDVDLARGLQSNFSTTRRRYDHQRMDEEEKEWQRRWQSQLDNLMQRSMHKGSSGCSGRTKSTSSWGNPTRRKRNSIFDLGFN